MEVSNHSIKNTAMQPCALLFLLAVPLAAAEALAIDEDRAWDYSSWEFERMARCKLSEASLCWD